MCAKLRSSNSDTDGSMLPKRVAALATARRLRVSVSQTRRESILERARFISRELRSLSRFPPSLSVGRSAFLGPSKRIASLLSSAFLGPFRIPGDRRHGHRRALEELGGKGLVLPARPGPETCETRVMEYSSLGQWKIEQRLAGQIRSRVRQSCSPWSRRTYGLELQRGGLSKSRHGY